MDLNKTCLTISILSVFIGTDGFILSNSVEIIKNNITANNNETDKTPDNVFNGVYTECFLYLSYSCLQEKTLLYLKELNNLSEVSVIGDYVKFVKINTTTQEIFNEDMKSSDTDELACLIDKAVDNFFDNHILKFNALGRKMSMPRDEEEFVGRKKRKGGGGGGGGSIHDDGGSKKKMMMMAMMCMKMKLMMMVPAMMGMMGMMSFKGMMFSMMSFMASKIMLIMKLLEKKGGAGFGGGGGGGGGGDGGWAASGAGAGAWMPAGGQDYGGGGGGYDANGQWQSRSIIEIPESIDHKPLVPLSGSDIENNLKKPYKVYPINNQKHFYNQPRLSYMKPIVKYNNDKETEVLKTPVLFYKKSNVDFKYDNEPNNLIESDIDKKETLVKNSRKKRGTNNKIDCNFEDRTPKISYEAKNVEQNNINLRITNEIDNDTRKLDVSQQSKSRSKRSILDILQSSYHYWMSKILGLNNNNRRTNVQKYKIINGVKYIYYPFRLPRPKKPKEIQLSTAVKVTDEPFKPIITSDDFNKGEIFEGAVESRMHRRKFHKMKDTMNDTVEENPWE